MKFNVLFDGGSSCAIKIEQQRFGLKGLDAARNAVGLPNLEADRVVEVIASTKRDPKFEITEEQARNTGHFQDRSYAKVRVKPGALNGFTQILWIVSRDNKTGEIKEVEARIVVDHKKIWEAWEEANFPIDWDIKTEFNIEEAMRRYKVEYL